MKPPRASTVAGAGAVLALGGLYAATAARTVQGADNGEFCALFAAPGVAHPPGYPLYLLLLRGFSWLPAASPCHGAALATALVALASAATLFAACRAWGARPGAAAVAAGLYALSPLAWDLGTQAEVFAPNALVAAAILTIAAPAGPLRGTRRAAALGLLAGLGIANHHSIVLLAPVGLWAAGVGVREAGRRAPLAGALALLGLLLGLAPYLYLAAVARAAGPEAWVWGEPETARGLLHHFLRADYGTGRLTLRGGDPQPAAHLAALGRRLLGDLLWLPPLAGLGAWAAALAGRLDRTDRGRRRALAALALTLLTAGPLFVARFNLDLGGLGGSIARRFHLLPMLVLSVFVALGLDVLAARAVVRPAVRAIAAAAVLAAAALAGFAAVAEHRQPIVERYLADTLDPLPPGAVLLGDGDHLLFGTLYLQQGLGRRRDVLFVSPRMLHHPWYHRRASALLGAELLRPQGGNLSTVALAEQFLAAGRPLFLVDPPTPAIPQAFPTYPIGTALRVLPRGTPLPAPAELEAMNVQLFARLRLHPRLASAEEPWSALVRAGYQRPWAALADAYRRMGDADAAERNARRASLTDR